MFEQKLKELKIKHKLIKSYTSRHNEKVERSHRKDQERFPMRPLKWVSPNDKYKEYIRNESSIIA